MKKFVAIGALAIMLLAGTTNYSQAAVAVGDQLLFNGGDLGGPGGRFHVTDLTSGDLFDTFCVELFEHIGYGGTYVVDGLSDTFAERKFSPLLTRPLRSSALNPLMLSLSSSVAGSIGVANWMLTPKRCALVSPSGGPVWAMLGRAIVAKFTVRSAALTPPRAPRRPFEIETT